MGPCVFQMPRELTSARRLTGLIHVENNRCCGLLSAKKL